MNNIAVQSRVYRPEQQILEEHMQKNEMTIDCVVEVLPVHNSGVRIGPSVINTAEVDCFCITRKA